jgi:hypothetical protein
MVSHDRNTTMLADLSENSVCITESTCYVAVHPSPPQKKATELILCDLYEAEIAVRRTTYVPVVSAGKFLCPVGLRNSCDLALEMLQSDQILYHSSHIELWIFWYSILLRARDVWKQNLFDVLCQILFTACMFLSSIPFR